MLVLLCYLLNKNNSHIGFSYLLVIEELKATGKFEMMDHQVDEAEHSMEMHLPYLARVFHGFVLINLMSC